MFGVTQSLGTFAADTTRNSLRTDWLVLPISRDHVRPLYQSALNWAEDVSEVAVDVKAWDDNQTILLVVNTIQTDGTTPTTPTITNSAITWVEVATLAYDTTGSNRGKLTLFRAQASSAAYFDSITIDYATVVQDTIHCQIWLLDGEDRSGTNGSAAIVQSATATAASDADVSATLAAFGNSKNATMSFVGALDDTAQPQSTYDRTEWDDRIQHQAWYGAPVAWFTIFSHYKFANETAPIQTFVSNALASGMIAVELKKDLLNPSADVGELAMVGAVGYVPAGLTTYSVNPRAVEYRFQT